MEFKDRTTEVRDLLKKISSKQKQIIIIYGRRRIGKTALALHITKNEKFIYYLARETQNLDKFYYTCAKKVPEILDLKKDYQILFKYIRNKVNVVIIDEFQNLILEDREILNTFQYIIDILLSDSSLKLILLGSSISLMAKNRRFYCDNWVFTRAGFGVKRISKESIKKNIHILTGIAREGNEMKKITEEALELAQKLEKDNTLVLPLVDGVSTFTGSFTDSNGDVWELTARKFGAK